MPQQTLIACMHANSHLLKISFFIYLLRQRCCQKWKRFLAPALDYSLTHCGTRALAGIAIEKDLINEDDVDKFMMCATAECSWWWKAWNYCLNVCATCIGLSSWLSIFLHDFLFYSQPDCIKGDVLCLHMFEYDKK